MNRRNFILGLGTAATLSGAASVTGAALSNQVTSTANFKIVSTDELTVRRNSNLDGTALENNGNFSNVSVSSFDHSNAAPYPNMTINETENGNLGMALATNNTASEEYNTNSTSTPYNGTNADPGSGGAIGPLEVENNGGTAKDVGVEYILGSDYNSGNMNEDDVAQLFTWNIDGTQISPEPDNGTTTSVNGESPGYENDTPNVVSVEPGETKTVNLVLNYNDTLEDKVASAASDGSGSAFGFDGSNTAEADLLDSVVFGDNS